MTDTPKTPEQLLAENPNLRNQLAIKWLPEFIPHAPTPKQHLFLSLPHKEAFFGGAAGGGKSDALLMGALQYVDVPGFSAIIFRRTFTDLQLPDALIQRSHQWLSKTQAKWRASTFSWTFPSGATLVFGYLSDETKRYRYQGAAFQYIAFDELTQFYEDDYLYLHSRLRKPDPCPNHKPPKPDICIICRKNTALHNVPLRVRAAANPGGVGHLWVKQRFDIGPVISSYNELGHPLFAQHPRMPGRRIFAGRNPARPYIPSLLLDNPYLDQESYTESLQNLDPVTREQLLSGDWAISSDGRFRREWVRYYTESPPYILLHNRASSVSTPNSAISVEPSHCQKFITVDPAASVKEGPGDNQIYRGAPSHTVISTFLLTPDNHLIWLDMTRFRKEIPDVYEAIKTAYREHSPDFIGIENSGLGIGIYQACIRAGLPIKPLSPRSRDKLVRATDAINRMSQGRIWLPKFAPWLEDAEAEIFSWTGHPHEPADIIDTLAYAAMYVSQNAAYSYSEDRVTYTTSSMYDDHIPDVVF